MTFGVYVNHLRESPGQLQVAIAIPAMFYTNVDNDKYAHEPQPQTQAQKQTQTGTHSYSHYIQS